jgi:hypothetical protein
LKNELLHSHNSSKEFETRSCIINELKELFYMAVCPHVKEVINALAMKLGQESLSMKKKSSNVGFSKTKMVRNCCRMQK